MYMVVDKNTRTLVESEEPVKNDDYAIYVTSAKTVYPLKLFDIILSGKHYLIGSKSIPIEDCELMKTEDAMEKSQQANERLILKCSEHKIKNPSIANYKPFTKAVIQAILKHGKDIPLTESNHNKRSSLIREFNKKSDGSSDISIKNAEEMLKLYGLSITDILKQELLI